jgi:disease resistance protein RPS2
LGTLPQLKALGGEALGFAEFESLREAANLPVRYLSLMELNQESLLLCDILSNNFAQRTLYELDIRFCSILKQIIVRHDTQQPNNHFAALNKIRMIGMLLLKEITWMGVAPTSIFPGLTVLDLFDCPCLLHLSWVMYLPRLEQLHIAYCRSMVQAFMRCHGEKLCTRQEKTKTFPCLKFLRLIDHRLLDTIGDNDMQFPSLERLVIYNCPKLKRLPFQLDSLPLNLKELWLDDVQYWEGLECEEGVKSFLQTALKFGPNMVDV